MAVHSCASLPPLPLGSVCREAEDVLVVEHRQPNVVAVHVEAFDRATLARRWQAEVDRGMFRASDGSTLIFDTSRWRAGWTIEARDAQDGHVRWRSDDPTADNIGRFLPCGGVFVARDLPDRTHFRLIAFDAATGHIAWSSLHDLSPHGIFGHEAYACAGDRLVHAIERDGIHVRGVHDGKERVLVALPELQLAWVAPHEPVAAHGSTFVWAEPGSSELEWRVVALDVDRGAIVWKRNGASKLARLVVDDDEGVHALSDDEQVWRTVDGKERERGATAHVVVQGHMTSDVGNAWVGQTLVLGRATAVTDKDGHYRIDADLDRPLELRWSRNWTLACPTSQYTEANASKPTSIPRVAGTYTIDVVASCGHPR